MKTTIIIITLLIISGIFIFFAGIYPKQAEKVINLFSDKEINLDQESSDDNLNTQNSDLQGDLDSNSETNSASNAGGGGGAGGGSGDGSGTDGTISSDCTLQQISYGIKNFIKTSKCTEYLDENCISKEIDCSAEVYNYDYETSGDFELEFRLTDESKDIINTLYRTEVITSRGNKTLNVRFTLEEENANKILTCNYQTTTIPKKTVC